jgi:hypothetical protein
MSEQARGATGPFTGLIVEVARLRRLAERVATISRRVEQSDGGQLMSAAVAMRALASDLEAGGHNRTDDSG